ncbi:alkyl hydroperoxide reductase subunit F, partial [Pseudomonas aeruginosa]|nr:alkyl hydroperoxide reductase subunit F [Pseudomonas aeruginosa]
MLDANLQSQLKTYLERVTRPIQITAHTDDGAKSQEMLELLQTLESLSDKISLQVLRDGQGRVPSFDLGTPGQDIHLTFAGLPMGHEFTSLVLALLQVGGHPS